MITAGDIRKGVIFDDGTSIKTNVADNPYYKGFINNCLNYKEKH